MLSTFANSLQNKFYGIVLHEKCNNILEKCNNVLDSCLNIKDMVEEQSRISKVNFKKFKIYKNLNFLFQDIEKLKSCKIAEMEEVKGKFYESDFYLILPVVGNQGLQREM